MRNNIEIDKLGKIKQGSYANWFVKVVDDTNGTTGGYYINIIKGVDLGMEAYDDWVENLESLEGYFEEVNWEVDWEISS